MDRALDTVSSRLAYSWRQVLWFLGGAAFFVVTVGCFIAAYPIWLYSGRNILDGDYPPFKWMNRYCDD